MEYKLKAYCILEYGQRKDADGNPHQEDCIFPQSNMLSDSDRLFILCDGMGGHELGEVASSTVCESMGSIIVPSMFSPSDFSTILETAYDALDRKDSGSMKKMGTTMTMLCLFGEGAFIAHIGDSRVYHIRPGETEDDTKILHVTRDHSLINELIKIGEITKEEARHSKQKNVITRAMQPNEHPRCKADIYTTSDIMPGDYFYLCSDGMLEQPDMEDGSILKRIFSNQVESDERKVEILKGATALNKDNHSAIMVHILDVIEKSSNVEECSEVPTHQGHISKLLKRLFDSPK